MSLWRRRKRPKLCRLSKGYLGVCLPDGRVAIAHGELLVGGFWIASKQIEWEDGSPLRNGDRERILAAFRDASERRRNWTLVVDYEGLD